VHRLGFGAMHISGDGTWGPPRDRAAAVSLVRRAVELGVNHIDTADSYGPHFSEEVIREAVHPYDGLLVATKAGLLRTGPNQFSVFSRPDFLRQQCEMSLWRLGVECIDLFYLHRIDPDFPAADQFGVLKELQDEGKVRALGLSEVSVAELKAASEIIRVDAVQSIYNLTERKNADILEYCTAHGIGFVPWFPIAGGQLVGPGSPVHSIAQRVGGTPSQIALAWLLARSPAMLPIPGTRSFHHLEENCGAALALDDVAMTELDALATASTD
jgi:aryl-alcohol dehydrogenase-like predicted oxidoreductase